MTRRWVVIASVVLLAWAVASCTGGDEAGTEDVSTSVPPAVGVGGERPLVETTAGELPPEALCPADSDPDAAGPSNGARPGRPGPMAFDRESGRIVLVEFPKPRTWAFDVCTNTWQQMRPQEAPSARIWSLAYDVDSDLTIALDEYRTVWAYDLETNGWTEKTARFPGSAEVSFRMVYDPISGLVIARGDPRSNLWAYDIDADVWARVPVSGDRAPLALTAPDHHLFAYDASTDRFLLVDAGCGSPTCPEGSTWTFDRRSGAWTPSKASTPSIATGYFASGGEIAYDEAAERMVAYSDGVVDAYDAEAETWARLYRDPRGFQDDAPQPAMYIWIVYDSVNDRLVYVETGWGASVALHGAVWAFDVQTREWLRLLAPNPAGS